MVVIRRCLFPLEHHSHASLKKMNLRFCIIGLLSCWYLSPCTCPFGACLCNSAVHATNLDALQDLTVQIAAMFSCSHVRYSFQVFSVF